MYSIGQKVRITRINKNDCGPTPPGAEYDQDGNWIEVDKRKTYVGQIGEVVKREFGTGKWPVGETAEDLLYIIKTPLGTDAFWSEELTACNP